VKPARYWALCGLSWGPQGLPHGRSGLAPGPEGSLGLRVVSLEEHKGVSPLRVGPCGCAYVTWM
jgi:hypothetical protein